jgi:flagellar assembly factor FliW
MFNQAARSAVLPSETQGMPQHMEPSQVNSDASRRPGATLTFKTRFGEVELREDRLLTFPQGVFGFRECTSFGLARLPNLENSPLLLLQCTNQPSIAFLVADPHLLGAELTAEDKTEALEGTGMDTTNTQFLTILTLYDQGESFYLTANLKAPVLVNSETRTGVQFILSNKSYSTQHKL